MKDQVNLNTILMVITVAVLGWVGYEVAHTGKQMAALEVKIDNVTRTQSDHELRLRYLERGVP